MATCFPAPDPIQSQFFIPGSNTPGNGVLLFSYSNLTSTKATVYKDSAGATPHTNPIVLASDGNLPNGSQVYILSGDTLTFKYAPANDSDPPVSVYRTLNDIEGINDISVSVATNEWTAGTTPTFISATSFSVTTNQTATYTVGRRVKTTNTGGTVYSTIVSSAFGAVTTVTVVNDSGVLDSGLSAVEYGLLSSVNPSVPGVTILNNAYTFYGSSTTFKGPLDISTSTAGQIKFPSSSNASANQNTLDDYSEGAWTPALSFNGNTSGFTYTADGQIGNYTKIGNFVNCRFSIDLTSTGVGAGSAKLVGLPFTPSTTRPGFGSANWAKMSASLLLMNINVDQGSTEAFIYGLISGSTSIVILQSPAFTNSSSIYGMLSYRT